MNIKFSLFFVLGLMLTNYGQEPTARETTMQQLFDSREEVAFSKATVAAKKLGIDDQVILEATFLYHVDKQEFSAIVELTKQFQKMAGKFDPNKSQIFSSKQDWQSVIEYGSALKALEEGNIPLFKKHIKEAFWLSPSKAEAFAPHINKLHIQKAMKVITLDLNRPIFQINAAKTITLTKMLETNDAIILRFWSPWNQQSENFLPLIKQLAQQCAKNKIAFASILISKDKQAIKDTKEVINELKGELPSLWLADENKSPLTKQFRVTNLPSIILINKQGKVLFNGSIMDNSLWSELVKIKPSIKPLNKN